MSERCVGLLQAAARGSAQLVFVASGLLLSLAVPAFRNSTLARFPVW